MNIKPATKAERLYLAKQSQEISMITEFIGHLTASLDTEENVFLSKWETFIKEWNTPEFKADLDLVLHELRFGEKTKPFLANRKVLMDFCFSHLDAALDPDFEEFGFRLDTESYVYMMKVVPKKGDFNVWIYCYTRKWFDRHLKHAEKGIQFTDASYQPTFRIPDGGTVEITYSDGKKFRKVCRYIDEYHMEIGDRPNLFHIHHFAEIMENSEAKVMPYNIEI